ncbi:acetoacetate--CoA ligase [Streptomyces calidiresistens]|uniref:Acetoacetate--CoA ligase n=1 Tax=Streptomyces calidiresistens TaxID=1485586 RepID=A0A7W3T4F0_9ACTN|nr:acetoacetate--CoA ligase [Streptomyces calidiresistens]MBB0230727.1 acetoacetate--CoA ligase [Streptomyces calidiresistens]
MTPTTGPEPEPTAPTVLWRPDADTVADARLTAFHARAAERYGAPAPGGEDPAADYRALHRWSVTDPDAFWSAVADFCEVSFVTPPRAVLADRTMPGAVWFPGAELNYAWHALRRAGEAPDEPVVLTVAEPDAEPVPRMITGAELRGRVGAVAAALRGAGVRPGDRVCAYLPNVPEALIAFLASAAVGAVWTSCSPDFGPRAVLDRFRQVEPVVLFAADGYRWAGRTIDRTGTVAELRRELPGLRATIHVPLLGTEPPAGTTAWEEVVARPAEPEFAVLPFDHPLWILYSSGTTGLPKALVQSHGGILLEHLKQLSLHCDLRPGDRMYWYTSTGWMMWNFLISALLVGAVPVLHDGAPAHPRPDVQWRVAAEADATLYGTSAAYVMACAKAGVHPGEDPRLAGLRCVATTGSPLPPDGFRWLHRELGDRWIASVSGGTDVCSCFVGAVPTLPVRAGELQAVCLGTDLRARDADGREVIGGVGELMVALPMPSMPIAFWNDPDGERYRESYFTGRPGEWRHGDWITVTPHGGVVIHGRSDSTLNRQGVRMGSADIHEVVERLPGVRESLVVGVEEPDGGYWMPLFVHPAEGVDPADLAPGGELHDRIRADLRSELSPRHVPDEIVVVPGLPHTLTGKRLEVPVKRLLSGTPLERAVNPGSVDRPELLEFFVRLAAERRSAAA